MTSTLITRAAELAALLQSMPSRSVEDEREQTLALCSVVRILADACSGECGAFIDCASDVEAQIEREAESIGVAA